MSEKDIVNTAYHAAVDVGISIGYAELAKKFFKTSSPKLDVDPRNFAMDVVYLTLADYTREMLVKKGVIPENIVK